MNIKSTMNDKNIWRDILPLLLAVLAIAVFTDTPAFAAETPAKGEQDKSANALKKQEIEVLQSGSGAKKQRIPVVSGDREVQLIVTQVTETVPAPRPRPVMPVGSFVSVKFPSGDTSSGSDKVGRVSARIGINRPLLVGGTYTILPNDVPNWDEIVTPTPPYHTVVGDEDIDFTVTYSRDRGTLIVNTVTSDNRNLPTGAGWTVGTKPDDYAGIPGYSHTFVNGIKQHVHTDEYAETGDYSITPNDVNGWRSNVSLTGGTVSPSVATDSGTLTKDGGLEFTVEYTPILGSLHIIQQTSDGRNLPVTNTFVGYTGPTGGFSSRIKSGGASPFIAKFTDKFLIGTYEFRVGSQPIPGWSQSVSVSGGGSPDVAPSADSATGELEEGGTLVATYTFTLQPATLQIVLNTGGSSATYSVDGPGGFVDLTNQASGQTINIDGSASKPYGNYSVDFSNETGYSLAVTTSVNFGAKFSQSDPSSGSADPGQAHVVTATYTRLTGNLKITTQTNDGRDLPAGSGWSFGTKPVGYAGFAGTSFPTATAGPKITILPSVITGTYGVNPKDVAGWSEDVTVSGGTSPGVAPSVLAPNEGVLEEDGTLEFTVTYTRQTGTLNINVIDGSVQYTLPNTAGFDITASPGDYTGPTSQAGGEFNFVRNDAVTGEYTVDGKDVDGWRFFVKVQSNETDVAPSVTTSKTGELLPQSELIFTIEYFREEGELTVVTETFDGRNLPVGAGWDLTHDPGDYDGDTSKIYNANETSPQDFWYEDSATGVYTVTGKPVVGWTFNVIVEDVDARFNAAPSAESAEAELEDSAAIKFTVTYTINRYELEAIYWDPANNVQVPGGTINPANTVVEHGAAAVFTTTTPPTDYQLLGTASYTGTSLGASMAANVATVSGIGSDGTVRIDVELALGELQVIILPESIRPQAGWKFQGGGAFKPSSPAPAGTEALITGFYDLEFAPVDGWFAPDPIKDIQVLPNQKRVVTVVYTENPAGSLQVFIEDNFDERVNDLGAQWQPVFPAGSSIGTMLADTWYNSGDVIAGIEPGDVGIRFKTLAGWVLPELSSATVEANKTTKETGEYYRVLVIHKSDYNGDGTDDLATFDKSSGTWSVASIGKPAAIPGAVDLFEQKFGRATDIPASGDYDGDGVADLAYWRESTGEWRVSRQFKLKNFGQAQDIPVPGDYNGDGMTDPALFRPSTGEWIIYNAETKKTTKVSFGAFGDVPVPGNYDADTDGMTDLAIFNVETRKWRVAIFDANKNKWVEKKKVKVNGKRLKLNGNHGAVGNVPVHADYDGDGATDFAVYARGSSEWDIRGASVIQLGERGDVPVANDWAGLGRVIPTIFRSQNGRWISIDNLLRTKHGRGGQPLMSGR